jgi:hypothetical protein
MRVTIDVPESFIAKAQALVMTPESYAEKLLQEHAAKLAATKPRTEEEMIRFVEEISSYSVTIPALRIESFSREAICFDHDSWQTSSLWI